jgi:hypothetical protein
MLSGGRVVASVAALLGATGLFALAVAVRSGSVIVDAADAIAEDLQASPAASAVLDAANVAGGLPVWSALVGILAVIAARLGAPRATEVILVAIGSEIAATAVKILVARPRPPGGSAIEILVAAGFPSGHVTRTAVLVGMTVVVVPWATRRPRVVIPPGSPLSCLLLWRGFRFWPTTRVTSSALCSWQLPTLAVGT